MKNRAVKTVALLIAFAFLIPIVAGPVAAAPAAHDPLNYQVYYMKDANQFYFLVTNPSNQVVKLNFPTAREFNLVVKKGNQVVWRYSDTKEFDKQGFQENFLPGHAKFYKVDVPQLPADNYTLSGFFAGGVSNGQAVAEIPLNFGNSSGWQPPVTDQRGLNYRLFQPNSQELIFVVENNSSRSIKVNYPTGKEFDLMIYNAAWQKVWQDEWNKWYPQKGKSETLAPGQAKIFSTKLPNLSRGNYTAQAYFYGVQGSNYAASLNFTVGQASSGGNWNDTAWDLANKLSFGAWFNGGKQPQIAFEVKNKTNQPVKIAYPVSKGIEVIVKGDNGFTWRYSSNLGSLATTEIAAGGASYSFIYPPSLPKGNYKADIYYHAYSSTRPAASTSFRI